MNLARTMIGLVLLVILAVLSVWVFIAMQGDDSIMLGYALGNPTERTVEMHLEITQMMSDTDTYAYSNESGMVRWPEWAGAHFIVTDPQGDAVAWRAERRSNLVTEAQHRGFTVLFLIGTLELDTPYTFTYVPVVGGPDVYAYGFTPTTQNLGRQRVTLQPLR